MKKLILLIAITFSMVLLTGCSEDSGGSQENVSSTEELDGSWKSSTGGYPFDVDNGSMIVYQILDEVIEERYIRISTVGEKVTQPNNLTVKKIDVTIESYSVILLTQARVDQNNAEATCGFTDWNLNVRKDIGLCGTTSYTTKDIYRIDSTFLLFGDYDSIGTDGYPDTLDGTRSWTRK